MIRETLVLTSAGIIAGLLATVVAGGFVSSLLFGLTTTDGQTLGYVGALLLVGGVIAGYLPARRASRVSPTIALQAE
jgi:ABC-type antimicrobial peptide transport system permease subunit